MSDHPARSLNPPRQNRSQRTLERLVRASLDILDEQGPTALTVQAIVTRADSSVGSFYARFKGKDDLLDYLGERVWQEALDRWNTSVSSHDWSELDLRQLAEGSVRLLSDAQRSRSSYLKSLDRAAGRNDDAYVRFRRPLLDGIGTPLGRDRSCATRPRRPFRSVGRPGADRCRRPRRRHTASARGTRPGSDGHSGGLPESREPPARRRGRGGLLRHLGLSRHG